MIIDNKTMDAKCCPKKVLKTVDENNIVKFFPTCKHFIYFAAANIERGQRGHNTHNPPVLPALPGPFSRLSRGKEWKFIRDSQERGPGRNICLFLCGKICKYLFDENNFDLREKRVTYVYELLGNKVHSLKI